MNLASVMDAIGTRLDTITGLRVFKFPPDGTISPPAAIVSYPLEYEFDSSYARGSDRMSLPVIVLVGKVSDRKSRDQLGAFCDGSGSSSVKAVVEAGTYTAFDTVRVASVEFDVISVAAVEHAAATFTLDIIGPGS